MEMHRCRSLRRFHKEDRKDIEILIDPETPFWFVPNTQGADLLSRIVASCDSEDHTDVSDCAQEGSWLDLLSPNGFRPYAGKRLGPLERLSEVWFHLTDACNLQCGHCLFGGKPGPVRMLDPERLIALAEEAYGLGSRVFCFTGGEPFLYPRFTEMLRRLLRYEDIRVAVLTNGLLVPDHLGELSALDRERLFIQVSLDGPKYLHETLRGEGTYDPTCDSLRRMVDAQVPCGIAMAVNALNVFHMVDMVGIVDSIGSQSLHFMWHISRGTGRSLKAIGTAELIERFKEAVEEARSRNVVVDNLEAMRAQVFSHAGTRYDFGNAAWESLAIGPDESIYPTPVTIDLTEVRAGSARDGVERVWRDSPVLEQIRAASLTEVPGMAADPWRFVIGGGDLDQCLVNSERTQKGIFLSDDPLRPIYREMALMVIEQEAMELPVPKGPGFVLRMGDITTDCPSGRDVNFTHCNCLLSMGIGDGRGLVRSFYSERAQSPDEVILNPVTYDRAEIGHIPLEALARMYGCGSPVFDAKPAAGETLVDLGSGTGVECFVGAKAVGREGLSVGVDMTDAMLAIARKAQPHVSSELGYENTDFRKGFLESLPLEDDFADVVISNCVVNLSHNKRKVFSEIFRVLKPGGRLVISDVVAESDPPLSVRADHQLIGECLGGALVQEYLFTMLREIGFVNAAMVKRFPYRVAQGHPFYSLTFRAYKPTPASPEPVVYAGPFQAVITDDGQVLRKGKRTDITVGPGLSPEKLAAGGLFTLDNGSGGVTNIDAESSCGCFIPPTESRISAKQAPPATGCLICGEDLVYQTVAEYQSCAICGEFAPTKARCRRGHFVCDACHADGPLEITKRLCLGSRETDVFPLFYRITNHPIIPMHGPEYHGIVPGVLLAVYRNLGGDIDNDRILEGINRGALVPGGSCAFLGTCGAAVGVGIAFGVILEATPLKAKPRRIVQSVVSETLAKICSKNAARCCRREAHWAFVTAAEKSAEYLPVTIRADLWTSCERWDRNELCIRGSCPFYKRESDAILFEPGRAFGSSSLVDEALREVPEK